MLDIKFIRQNPDKVKQGCQNKQVDVDIDKFLKIDREKNEKLKALEDIKFQKNKSSKVIAAAPSEKEKRKLILQMQKLDKTADKLSLELKNLEEQFQELWLRIPNLPQDDVPVGQNESENVTLREAGAKTKFDFEPEDYLEIAEKLDWIDVKRAAKVSGTRFGYLKKKAVLLELGLINLAMDTLMKEGFVPVFPPVMMKPEMMAAMGYIASEKLKGQGAKRWIGEEVYFLKDDNLLLIGTAEQSVGAMHAEEIFEEKDLPGRYVGFSTCFRREAGAYGKDTRGIIRVHQFDKVEMFSFCKPGESRKEHLFMLAMEEKLMQLLEIPYRVVQMCTGDLGTPAAAKYDIEAWMPGQAEYRETHSTSNCTDFQARRLNIRYRDALTKKLEFVHTLNGTAIAIGRMLVAIIENYQQKDGTIKIPRILQKYMIEN